MRLLRNGNIVLMTIELLIRLTNKLQIRERLCRGDTASHSFFVLKNATLLQNYCMVRLNLVDFTITAAFLLLVESKLCLTRCLTCVYAEARLDFPVLFLFAYIPGSNNCHAVHQSVDLKIGLYYRCAVYSSHYLASQMCCFTWNAVAKFAENSSTTCTRTSKRSC